MIYLDKVDGRITAEFHDRIAASWREERARAVRSLEHLSSVDEAYVDDGVALLDVMRRAHEGFADLPAEHRRRALNLALSNCTWANGKLSVEFRQPFGMLEELSNAASLSGSRIQPQTEASDSLVGPAGIEPAT